jgi:hypothetical protein
MAGWSYPRANQINPTKLARMRRGPQVAMRFASRIVAQHIVWQPDSGRAEMELGERYVSGLVVVRGHGNGKIQKDTGPSGG